MHPHVSTNPKNVHQQGNCRIRQVNGLTGVITTIAGSTCGSAGNGGPALLALLNAPGGLLSDGAGGFIVAGKPFLVDW